MSSFEFRNFVMGAAIAGSAVAAVWLSSGSATQASAPAQVLSAEYKVSVLDWGKLAELNVQPGQQVHAGERIAKQETAILEREIAAATARLQGLGAETIASRAEFDTSGYAEERSFHGDVNDAARQLEMARASHASQEVELRQLREELERQQNFLRDGLARRDRVDALDLRRRVLEASLAEWPARLEELQKRLAKTEARLLAWKNQHSATATQSLRLKPSELRVSEQQESLRLLREKLKNATILSPIDGTVLAVFAQPGGVVGPGDPLVLIARRDSQRVLAYLNERDFHRAKPGQKVNVVRRTAARETYQATVRRLADAVAPIPARFWPLPQVPVYGREVELELLGPASLQVGEALDATLSGGPL